MKECLLTHAWASQSNSTCFVDLFILFISQVFEMPTNGDNRDKLPNLYNSSSNYTIPQLRRDSLTNRYPPSQRRFSEGASVGQQRSQSRIGHRSIDVTRRPLGAKLPTGNNSLRRSNLSRSMEGHVNERNWDSEGGRPKSPQRQPPQRQTKKSGFKRLLQRPSFDGLMPFQRAPRDGSYERTLPATKNRTLDAAQTPRDKDSGRNTHQGNNTPRRFQTNATLSEETNSTKLTNSGAKNNKLNAKNNVLVNGKRENTTRQSSPTLTRLLRRRRSQDRSNANTESVSQNPTMSSTDETPLPLSGQSSSIDSDRGPNADNPGAIPYESPRLVGNRNQNDNIDRLLVGGSTDEPHSLPNSPPELPPRLPHGSNHFASARDGIPLRSDSTLIDISPREDPSSTTSPRHSINNGADTTSPRDPFSTLLDSSRRHSSPVPPPRTSASLGARDSPRSDMQRQPNSVFRQRPFLRPTTESPRSRDPPPRPRANSEQPRTRISSPRFRNLLSRRGSSSSSNSSREDSQNNDNTSGGNERESSSSRSFWRNSLFSRLGSAERRSRSRSESAASSQSNSSQDNPSSTQPQPSTTATNNPDTEFPGFPFRSRGMRDRGQSSNQNDSTSSRDLPSGPRIIRLTLGPTGGGDIGRLLAAASRAQDGSSGNTSAGLG